MAIYNSIFTGAEIDDAVQYAQDAITNDAASSLSSSGYQKLNSGLIIQWGRTSDVSPNIDNTISFPISFPGACLTFTLNSDYTVASGTINITTSAAAVTTSGATIRHTGNSTQIYWIAIGC